MRSTAATPITPIHARRQGGWLYRMQALLAVGRGRKRLAEMEASQLHDIGLSQDEALAESARPIWDVPPGWRL